MPRWVFCTTRGTMLNKGNVRRVFVRVLKRAELPMHFSPHCLHHTFASLLLQQGESLRPAAARPREHQAHRGYRQVAADGEQGGRGSARRRRAGSKW